MKTVAPIIAGVVTALCLWLIIALPRDTGPRFELLWIEAGQVSVMDYGLTLDDCGAALVSNPSPYLSCALEESNK